MRKWCKQIGVLGGCLLGLGGLYQPVSAQFGAGPPSGGGMFAGNPEPPTPPDFPNPGKAGTEKVSPFSLRDDGAPNAFSCIEGPPSNNAYHMTFRTEYLGWWISPMRIPSALATTSTANPITATDFGALGQPSTQTLLGPGNQSYGLVNGGRVTMGLAPGFMPPIEVSGLFLTANKTLLDASSGGSTILARPVQLLTAPTLVGAPGQSAALLAGPGLGFGSLNIVSRFNLWGIDTDMFYNLTDNGIVQFDLIGGYKYLDMNERLTISSTSTAGVPLPFDGIPGGVPPGVTRNVLDSFYTRNQFNGGTIGLRNRIHMGAFMLMTDTKLSLGSTYQYAPLTGTSTLAGAGGSLPVSGGVLALPSNALLTRHDFSIIPELNMSLSYQVTPNLRVFGGYNVLAWTRILRAADQIQTAIDPTQVPTAPGFIPGGGGTGPQNVGRTSTFFANGFNAGLEFGY